MRTAPLDKQRIVIVGAGALGGCLGGWLAAAGHEVSLIARGAHGEAMARDGLRLTTGRGGHEATYRLPVHASIAAAPAADLIVLAVKLWSLPAVIADLVAAGRTDGPVLALQNGLAAQELLPAHLSRPLFGIAHWNAWLVEPGRIVAGRRGPLVVAAPPGLAADRAAVVHALAPALPIVDCAYPRDAALGKLVLNLNNALLALVDYPRRQPDDFAHFQRWMSGLVGEGVAVLKAAGVREVRVPGVPPWWLLAAASRLPAWLTRSKFRRNLADVLQSSMAQDLERGSEHTELAELTGAFLALADEVGVAVPLNRALCELATVRFAERPFRPLRVADLP
jgi:2-dehydropantoate 2-reductase